MTSLLSKLHPALVLEPPPEPFARPIFRMSHSSNDKLQRCERKYQIACSPGKPSEIIVYPDLPFGSSVGDGIQEYIKVKSSGATASEALDAALFQALLSYHPLVEDPSDKQNRKFLERAFLAVESLAAEWDKSGLELLYLNDKPATELGFKIILNDHGDYFCGALDLGTRNPQTSLPGVVEVKTTGYQAKDGDLSPLYRHSTQALGYSTMLDIILDDYPNNFETNYLVSHLKRGQVWPESYLIPFQKTRLDRYNWMMMLVTDLNKAIACYESGFWPQRFQECLAYNRICPYYESCNLSIWNDFEKDREPGQEFGMPYNDGKVWDYEFTLKELFERTAA